MQRRRAAAARWLIQNKVKAGILAAALIIGATTLATSDEESGDGPQGSKMLESKESEYNTIIVYQRGPYVAMTFGRNKRLYTESIANTEDERELPVEYTRLMTIALAYVPRAKAVLEIGSGGGRTSWYVHKSMPDASVTSVELDPAVIDLERRLFGIRDEAGYRLVQSDGRQFLAHSKEMYDVILIDAYRGSAVPFHLLTTEFYRLAAEHLTPGGAVAVNVEPDTMLFDSAANTLHAVFENIDFYAGGGNTVTVATRGAPVDDKTLAERAKALDAALDPRYPATDMIGLRQSMASNPGAVNPDAPALTDDFAPVDAEKAIERHNRNLAD